MHLLLCTLISFFSFYIVNIECCRTCFVVVFVFVVVVVVVVVVDACRHCVI